MFLDPFFPGEFEKQGLKKIDFFFDENFFDEKYFWKNFRGFIKGMFKTQAFFISKKLSFENLRFLLDFKNLDIFSQTSN